MSELRPMTSILFPNQPAPFAVVDAEARKSVEQLAEDKPYQQYVTGADGKAKWEDRLAYQTFTEILPKTQISANESIEGGLYETVFNEPIVLQIGKTYQVVYNGTTYESVAWIGPPEYPYSLILLGNKSLFGRIAGVELPDTGEPFVLAYSKDSPNQYGFNVSHGVFVDQEFEISVAEGVPKLIPSEYLPPRIEFYADFQRERFYCNFSFEKCFELFANTFKDLKLSFPTFVFAFIHPSGMPVIVNGVCCTFEMDGEDPTLLFYFADPSTPTTLQVIRYRSDHLGMD